MIAALLLALTVAGGPAGPTVLPPRHGPPIVTAGPLPRDAVVYFVLVDRFADDDGRRGAHFDRANPRAFHGGDIDGLRRRLPYLRDLGVTHLWLTPLQRQVGRVHDTDPYHGYWPAELNVVDDGLSGHVGEFSVQQLLDEAAVYGIDVVLDLVVNHFGYGAEDPLRLVRPRCGNDETTGCLFGLPDLQTEDPRVRAVVVDQIAWWTRRFPDLAGVRIDAFKHVDRPTLKALHDALLPKPDGSSRFRPTASVSIDGEHREIQRPRERKFTVIAEDWGATLGDAHVDDIVSSGAADAVFDFGFAGPARDFLQGRMRTAAFAHHLEVRERASVASNAQTLPFLDNHDVETWTHAVGKDRSPIGAALLLSDTQVPVITWGTEVQRPGGGKDPDNRTDMPWDDVVTQQQDPSSSLAFWQKTITLRRRHAVLRKGALRIVAKDVDDTRPHFLVYARERPRDRAVVAVALDRPLRHVEPLDGRRIIDQSGWHGAARVEGDNLVVDVDQDGAVVVILQGEQC